MALQTWGVAPAGSAPLSTSRRPHLAFGISPNPKWLPGNPFTCAEAQVSRLTVGDIMLGLYQTQYRQSLHTESIGYWERQIKRLSAANASNPQLPKLTLSSLPATPVSTETKSLWRPQARLIDWGRFDAAPWETPLATAGLFSCSALVLIDPNTKRQLLMHPFPSSNQREISAIVQEFFNASNQSAYPTLPVQAWVVPGLLQDADWSADRLLDTATEAISQLPQLKLEKGIQFFDPQDSALGVMVHQGQLWAFPKELIEAMPLEKTLGAYDGEKAHVIRQERTQ